VAAGRVYEGDLVVPAGTPAAAPSVFVFDLPDGILQRITLVVPAGHSGLTGVQLTLAGTPIVPYGVLPWIIADDYTDSWEIDQEVNGGQVRLQGYNLDVYPHTFYVRALWQPPPPPPPVSVQLGVSTTPAPDLSGLGAGSPSGSVTGQPVAGPSSGGAGLCFDASGNVTDCSSPAAVSGALPGGSTSPAGGTTGTGPCYDITGLIVPCSAPTAVTGPVTYVPPGPGTTTGPPGPGQPAAGPAGQGGGRPGPRRQFPPPPGPGGRTAPPAAPPVPAVIPPTPKR
jgi:hypothetical protein